MIAARKSLDGEVQNFCTVCERWKWDSMLCENANVSMRSEPILHEGFVDCFGFSVEEVR